MLFDEIPIASFVDLLASGKVHTLWLKEDFRVVFKGNRISVAKWIEYERRFGATLMTVGFKI
jgi:hypothetical protein